MVNLSEGAASGRCLIVNHAPSNVPNHFKSLYKAANLRSRGAARASHILQFDSVRYWPLADIRFALPYIGLD